MVVLLFWLVLGSGFAFAAAQDQPAAKDDEVQEEAAQDTGASDSGDSLDDLSGVVVDRTVTRIGREFYTEFSEYRRLVYPDSPYNLTIFERPSARWGSLIWVEYNGRALFKKFLSPSRSAGEAVAKEAAEEVEAQLKQLKLQEVFSDTFDLERDEF